MKLYRMKTDNLRGDTTRNTFVFNFFARNPQHLVDLINTYYQQALEDGALNKSAPWVREVSSDDIAEVIHGDIYLTMGAIYAGVQNEGEALHNLHLNVTPDFTVHLNAEGLVYFDNVRAKYVDNKRGELYKIASLHALFTTLSFVPEDIMKAIVFADLKDAYKQAQPYLDKLLQLEHSNLKIGFSK